MKKKAMIVIIIALVAVIAPVMDTVPECWRRMGPAGLRLLK